jgi:hypothetical protein
MSTAFAVFVVVLGLTWGPLLCIIGGYALRSLAKGLLGLLLCVLVMGLVEGLVFGLIHLVSVAT